MKKRFLTIVLSLVLALSILPTIGLAADDSADNGGLSYACCSPEPSDTVKDAQMQVLELRVAAANARIEMLVMHAQATPKDDVDWLLRQVDNTVAPVFAYAERIGATVVCEYVEYTVDGQSVLIDPIHVVKR